MLGNERRSVGGRERERETDRGEQAFGGQDHSLQSRPRSFPEISLLTIHSGSVGFLFFFSKNKNKNKNVPVAHAQGGAAFRDGSTARHQRFESRNRGGEEVAPWQKQEGAKIAYPFLTTRMTQHKRNTWITASCSQIARHLSEREGCFSWWGSCQIMSTDRNDRTSLVKKKLF